MRRIPVTELLNMLEARVESHLQKAVTVYQNLSEQVLLQAANDGGWGIAQCLEHLNRYGNYYLPHIERVLQQPGHTPSSVFKGSWIGEYFTKMMDPTTGKKRIKAFKGYIPPPQLNVHAVVADFIQQQEKLLQLLNDAKQANLDRLKIPVSIAQWIHLRLGDVFQFLIAHNERHIVQADKVLKTIK